MERKDGRRRCPNSRISATTDSPETTEDESPGPPIAPPDPPLIAYRTALKRYDGGRLVEIHAALGGADLGGKPNRLPDAIADRLSEIRVADRMVAGLSHGSRVALGLFALTESPTWPASGMILGLTCLGVEPEPALRRLLELGLVSAKVGETFEPVFDYERTLGVQLAMTILHAHPSVLNAARTVLPEIEAPPEAGSVRQVRESDGLEAACPPGGGLAADRGRPDPPDPAGGRSSNVSASGSKRTLSSPGRSPTPSVSLPDSGVALDRALGRGVGLVVPGKASDRLTAASPGLLVRERRPPAADDRHPLDGPPRLARAGRHEVREQPGRPGHPLRPRPDPALARGGCGQRPESAWLAIDDLDEYLGPTCPLPGPAAALRHWPPGQDQPASRPWRRSRFAGLSARWSGRLRRCRVAGGWSSPPLAVTPPGRRRQGRRVRPFPVRPAEFPRSSPTGREPTPTLIGQFSRFARWSQVGAAARAQAHSRLDLPGARRGPGDRVDALNDQRRSSSRTLAGRSGRGSRTWASRRDRVTYYASVTLVEFATADDLEAAVKLFPTAGRVAPTRISDRLLLVEDESSIPFSRFRMVPARGRTTADPPRHALTSRPMA